MFRDLNFKSILFSHSATNRLTQFIGYFALKNNNNYPGYTPQISDTPGVIAILMLQWSLCGASSEGRILQPAFC